MLSVDVELSACVAGEVAVPEHDGGVVPLDHGPARGFVAAVDRRELLVDAVVPRASVARGRGSDALVP